MRRIHVLAVLVVSGLVASLPIIMESWSTRTGPVGALDVAALDLGSERDPGSDLTAPDPRREAEMVSAPRKLEEDATPLAHETAEPTDSSAVEEPTVSAVEEPRTASMPLTSASPTALPTHDQTQEAQPAANPPPSSERWPPPPPSQRWSPPEFARSSGSAFNFPSPFVPTPQATTTPTRGSDDERDDDERDDDERDDDERDDDERDDDEREGLPVVGPALDWLPERPHR